MITQVALVGYGYWGSKLARKLKLMGLLKYVVDSNERNRMQAQHDLDVKIRVDLNQLGQDGKLGNNFGVVIATPPETHYALAAQALAYGWHVLVEKPMCTNEKDIHGLYELARKKKVSLKGGHIYLFNPGIAAIPRPLSPCEIHVKLLNAGGAPSASTRDLLYAGMPHALSIINNFCPDEMWAWKVKYGKNSIIARMDGFLGNIATVSIADHTGQRRRGVVVKSDGFLYRFDADKPWHLQVVNPADLHGSNSIEVAYKGEALDPSNPKDPMQLELEDFLTGEGYDMVGAQVVSWMEQMQREKAAGANHT